MVNFVGDIGSLRVKNSGELEFGIVTGLDKEVLGFLADNCNATVRISIESSQLDLPGIEGLHDDPPKKGKAKADAAQAFAE